MLTTIEVRWQATAKVMEIQYSSADDDSVHNIAVSAGSDAEAVAREIEAAEKVIASVLAQPSRVRGLSAGNSSNANKVQEVSHNNDGDAEVGGDNNSSVNDEVTEARGTTTTLQIGPERRRNVIRTLALEQAQLRGFAGDFELGLVAPEAMQDTAGARRMSHVEATVTAAAAATVTRALDRMLGNDFQSVSLLNDKVSSVPYVAGSTGRPAPMSSTRTRIDNSNMAIKQRNSSSSSPSSASLLQSVETPAVATQRRAERDALVERLLAERAAARVMAPHRPNHVANGTTTAAAAAAAPSAEEWRPSATVPTVARRRPTKPAGGSLHSVGDFVPLPLSAGDDDNDVETVAPAFTNEKHYAAARERRQRAPERGEGAAATIGRAIMHAATSRHAQSQVEEGYHIAGAGSVSIDAEAVPATRRSRDRHDLITTTKLAARRTSIIAESSHVDRDEHTVASTKRRVSASRIARLAAPNSSVWATRRAQREAREAQELAAACTFQPCVHTGIRASAAERTRSSSEKRGRAAASGVWAGGGDLARAFRDRRRTAGADAAATAGSSDTSRRQAGRAAAAASSHQRRVSPTPLSSTGGVGVPPVAARLYADADARSLRRARSRAKVEADAAAAYKFTPTIGGARSGRASQLQPHAASTDAPAWSHRPLLHERAAALARERADRLAALRAQAAAADAQTLTFQPNAHRRGRVKAQPVVPERKSGASAHEAPHADSGAEGDIAEPATSRGVTPSAASAAERLAADAVAAAERRLRRQAAAAAAEASEYTFAPRVSETSERLARARTRALTAILAPPPQDSVVVGEALDHGQVAGRGHQDSRQRRASSATSAEHALGPSGFLARQALEAAAAAAEREAAAAAAAASRAASHPFMPSIGNAPAVLAVTRPSLLTETAAERSARLAGDAERLRRAREGAATAYYAQFSYVPEIDATSRVLAGRRVHTDDERAANEGGRRARERAAAAVAAEFEASHPFKPTLVAGDGGGSGSEGFRLAIVSDPGGVSARVAALQAAHEAKLAAAARKQEYDELAACTFAPATNHGVVPASSAAYRPYAGSKGAASASAPPVVVIRGLGRYLETKELARRIKEEKR